MSRLVLGAYETAASCARHHAVAVVHGWGWGQLADDVALVVSELVTNALRVVPRGTPVGLWVAREPDCVRLLVWDRARHLWPKPAEDQAGQTVEQESGRGLMIVAAVARQWGAYAAEGGGKVVWAEIATRRGPAG